MGGCAYELVTVHMKIGGLEWLSVSICMKVGGKQV
jgi:hypothetical protein